MAPDLLFILSLAIKMAVTAGFVVIASLIAERVGPLVAAMVSTLPIGSGPAYIFLALDHDVQFLEASTVTSLAVHAASGLFGMAYVVLAQRNSLLVSVSGAFAVWLACALTVRALDWTIWRSIALNVVVYAGCVVAAKKYLHVRMPMIRRQWFDVPLRATMVAVLVAVVMLSATFGPAIAGILAVFPIVMLSLMLIMHNRLGRQASAALLANTMWGLVGFALSILTLHVSVVPLGAPIGLTLALIVSVGINITIWLVRRRGHARQMAALEQTPKVP